MKKISARDIQVFVAGAFALWGFRTLIWLPSYLFVTPHNVMWVCRIVGSLLTSLSLPLGVAIFLGKKRAIRLTQIYLWLVLVLGFIDMVGIGVPLGSKALKFIGAIAPDMLVCIVLLWLISLSRSRRFRDEPDG
jgi:hypothetical protein